MRESKSFLFKSLVCMVMFSAFGNVNAETLQEGLKRIIVSHPLAKGTEFDVATAKDQVGIERSGWYPRLSANTGAGLQRVNRSIAAGGTDAGYNPAEVTLSLNQLLWDFGATNAGIARAEKNYSKEQVERTAQLTNLMLAGIEAHLKMLRAQSQLEYARQSEGNVKKQTQLENIRIESGKGYTTDLLQAKVQLAGAQARRVAAENVVQVAKNRYKAVFGEGDASNGSLELLREPDGLPKNVEDVVAIVETKNPDILAAIARADLKVAEEESVRTREWMPRIDAVTSTSFKHEFDGVNGQRDDSRLMVQASWNYDFGRKASHSVEAAQNAAYSEKEKADYTKLQAIEEARNAWADLVSARERLQFLRDQVSIAQRFLDLARKEREMGRRTLIDVLQGETNLINSQSDVAAAETDVVLGGFRVLRATGELDPMAVVAAR